MANVRPVCAENLLEIWLAQTEEICVLAFDLQHASRKWSRNMIYLNEEIRVFLVDLFRSVRYLGFKYSTSQLKKFEYWNFTYKLCLENGLGKWLAILKKLMRLHSTYIVFVQNVCSKYDARELNATELNIFSNMSRAIWRVSSI